MYCGLTDEQVLVQLFHVLLCCHASGRSSHEAQQVVRAQPAFCFAMLPPRAHGVPDVCQQPCLGSTGCMHDTGLQGRPGGCCRSEHVSCAHGHRTTAVCVLVGSDDTRSPTRWCPLSTLLGMWLGQALPWPRRAGASPLRGMCPTFGDCQLALLPTHPHSVESETLASMHRRLVFGDLSSHMHAPCWLLWSPASRLPFRRLQ